ncbi:Uncharacterised protein [Enterobacter cloacae]|nr:Uncharacterised protein [Enterobacter cloacae]
MGIAAPGQRMGEQTGINGFFRKRQMQRIRFHLNRGAIKRYANLMRDSAAFGIDFCAQISNLKQVKTIHFREPGFKLKF